MSVKPKNQADIEILRQTGAHHARILSELYSFLEPGVTLKEIDDLSRRLVQEVGGRPAFLGYQPMGATRPYPAAVCVSVNEEVVHGVPNEGNRTLAAGDIVSVDLGLEYQKRITDSAFTKALEPVDPADRQLITVTRQALERGVEAVRAGCKTGDIGAAVEAAAAGSGLSVIKHLSGHGVGLSVHEPPFIPNFGPAGRGEVLPEGAVIAIEPMLSRGSDDVMIEDDGFTYSTPDGSRNAHFEQTVLVTAIGAEILTPFKF